MVHYLYKGFLFKREIYKLYKNSRTSYSYDFTKLMLLFRALLIFLISLAKINKTILFVAQIVLEVQRIKSLEKAVFISYFCISFCFRFHCLFTFIFKATPCLCVKWEYLCFYINCAYTL